MGDGRGGISLSCGIFQSLDYRSRRFSLFSPSLPSSSSPNHHPLPLFRRAVRRLLDVVACRSWLSEASFSHMSGRSRWVDEVCSGTTDSVRFRYRFFSFFSPGSFLWCPLCEISPCLWGFYHSYVGVFGYFLQCSVCLERWV
ncbi:hypothetical protein RHMOL_Rhmol04G0104900 [Rhododendron molle]|uniref:Uncharacterized protein n=1 Tax=Rhododendron molle TaxID=49168 RepID=A0ACC0P156_RHOML|nr:hypothetical protein RHMOL_Rhmol04G0104900 [Rhododendron molle]